MFGKPICEVYLLFYQAILPVFNKYLQREDPCIHLVHDQCMSLLKKLIWKFIKIDIIRAASSLVDVDIDTSNQLGDANVFIGSITRQKLLKLEREGDVSPSERNKFYKGVRKFYERTIDYIRAKFPLSDDLLMHARFVNFGERENCEFADVEYFIARYQSILSFDDMDMDGIFDEFVEYQLLEQSDIPQHVWQSAKEKREGDESEESTFIRMDVVWAFLSSATTGDGCKLKFARLSKVARLILVLPHSNAGEERVFSMVRLNKTPYRSSLSLDGTLSSILTIKLHNHKPCYKFEPSADMLDNSKKATWKYNKKHSKK